MLVLLMCTRSELTNRHKGEIKEQSNFATSFHGIQILRSISSNSHPHMTCEGIHYSDVIMGSMASQITSLIIVYSTVYSDADQRKHQTSASLAFVRGPVNSQHKWSVTRKMFPYDDVIMYTINHHLCAWAVIVSNLTNTVVYTIIYENCFISRCHQFDWPTSVFMWWHIGLVYTIVNKNRFVHRCHKFDLFARIIIWWWRMSWLIHPTIIQLYFHHLVIHVVFCAIRFHVQVTRRVHFRLYVTSRFTGCSLAHTGVIPHRLMGATCCNCIFPGVACCDA